MFDELLCPHHTVDQAFLSAKGGNLEQDNQGVDFDLSRRAGEPVDLQEFE